MSMTLGEIGWVERYLQPQFDNNEKTLHYKVMTVLLLLVFIVMMPILLINLLIGLAVGDIVEVQSNAILQSLAMRVRTFL